MAVPISYRLAPTRLIPNSPYPLLHYRQFFDLGDGAVDILSAYDAFKSNGWDVQWVARYGRSQPSHYHPEAHEVMAVLTGPGTIRFGVGDTDADWYKNTYGDAWEDGGLEVQANAGDVFIIPAGVAHKSFDSSPSASQAILTQGGAHSIDSVGVRTMLKDIQLSGFTMIGAYPSGHAWSWANGGDHSGGFEKVWSVPKPESDPLTGHGGALLTLWK